MKKSIKFFVMAALALVSMSACNNEVDEPGTGGGKELQPVQFTMSMTNTRTVTGAENRVTSWKVGDAIGIFAVPAGAGDLTNAVATNAKYVLGDNDTWTAEAGSEIYPEVALDYYAYYPYQADVTDPTAINVSALINQSATNGDDYGASDVLAGQTKGVAAGQGSVQIAFKHMFAMVEVKIEGDKVTKQPTKVELKGVKLDAILNLMAATPAATTKTDAATKDITMYFLAKPGEVAQAKPFSFRAVVPAQEIAASTPLVAIYGPDAAGKTYTMQHTAAVPYNAGVFRQLNVNIGETKVSLTIPASNLTISPWAPSDDPIGGEGGEVGLVIPLSDNLTDVVDAPTNLTSDTWFALKGAKYTSSTTSTFSVIEDNSTVWKKAAKLSFTSSLTQGASWFVATIGYYHNTPIDVSSTNIYKITLKTKAEAITSKLVFTCRNAANNASFKISANSSFTGSTATSSTKTLSAANTWEEYTMYIDFSKKNAAVGTATTFDDTVADDYSKLDFRIYTNTPKTAVTTDVIYISDVTLEPYTGN